MEQITETVTKILGHSDFTQEPPIPVFTVYRANKTGASEDNALVPIKLNDTSLGFLYYFNQRLWAVYHFIDTLASKRPFTTLPMAQIHNSKGKVTGFLPTKSFVFRRVTLNADTRTKPYILFDDESGNFEHMMFATQQDLYLYLAYLENSELVLRSATNSDALKAIAAHQVMVYHLDWK